MLKNKDSLNRINVEAGENEDEVKKEDPFKKGILYDAKTFQEKVASGELSDDKGTAIILIDGSPTNYNVHIDRRCVTRSDGTLITHTGFLKMYSMDQITIRFIKKEKRLRSRKQLKLKQEEFKN